MSSRSFTHYTYVRNRVVRCIKESGHTFLNEADVNIAVGGQLMDIEVGQCKIGNTLCSFYPLQSVEKFVEISKMNKENEPNETLSKMCEQTMRYVESGMSNFPNGKFIKEVEDVKGAKKIDYTARRPTKPTSPASYRREKMNVMELKDMEID